MHSNKHLNHLSSPRYKFNDTEVTESNWDNLYQNAIGDTSGKGLASKVTEATPERPIDLSEVREQSKHSPSAYFLIYVKAEDENLYQENSQLTDRDLVTFIEDDYESLKKQIFNTRLKKLHKDCLEMLKSSNGLINEANQTSANPITDQNNQTCIEHVKAFKDSIIDCFSRSFEKISGNPNLRAPFGKGIVPVLNLESSGLQDALSMAVEIELSKYGESEGEVSGKLPDNDVRTHHILTYLSCNGVGRETRILALYDLFRIQIFAENNIKLRLMQMLAQIKFNDYVLAALKAEQVQSVTARDR